MAKSKNHTGHNQIYKNHRNGIKKQRRPRKMSMEGMNCRFVRNQAFAKRGMKCTDDEKAQRLAAQKEAQKKMEEKKSKERADRLKELAEAKEAEALKKFMYKKSVPLVGQKTWKSGERYDKQGVPVVTLFAAIDLEKNAKGFDYFANRLRKVAADYVGKLSFNIGDKEDFSYQLEDYGLELPSKKDVGVGAKDGNKYYTMEDKFNVDNVRKFAAALVAGSLEAKVKEESSYDDDADASGEADESDYEESDVTVLTDDNFEAEVEGKDAMLEFYAPWCGHCQSLKPTYKELGTRLVDADVVVGAMDATAHTPPAEYEVQGYPTLIFKTASGKTTSYDGDRDVDSMVTYIKENAEAESVKSEL